MVWVPDAAEAYNRDYLNTIMPEFTVGLDISKRVFQVYAIDRSGQSVIHRRLQ